MEGRWVAVVALAALSGCSCAPETCSERVPRLPRDSLYYRTVVSPIAKLKAKYDKAKDISVEEFYWKHAITKTGGNKYGRIGVRSNVCSSKPQWEACRTCDQHTDTASMKPLPPGAEILSSLDKIDFTADGAGLIDKAVAVPRIDDTSAFWKDAQEHYWLYHFNKKGTGVKPPADPQCNFPKRSKVVLVTFADGKKYAHHSKKLLLSVIKFGKSVDEFWVYDRAIMHPAFVESLPGSQELMGATSEHRSDWLPGNMIWKVYAIWAALHSLNKGDVLVYMDSDMELVGDPRPLVCMAHSARHGIVPFLNMRTERVLFAREGYWSKRDAFVLMGVDETRYAATTQSQSGILALRNSEDSIAFVSEWLSYSMDDRITGDSPSVLGPEFPHFRQNRHEQTVLSLLAKKWNLQEQPCIYSPDSLPWEEGCGSYTFLHRQAGTDTGTGPALPIALEGRDFDPAVVEAELRKLKPKKLGKKKVKLGL